MTKRPIQQPLILLMMYYFAAVFWIVLAALLLNGDWYWHWSSAPLATVSRPFICSTRLSISEKPRRWEWVTRDMAGKVFSL